MDGIWGEGVLNEGFQWAIIDVKDGADVVRSDDIGVGSGLQELMVEEVAEHEKLEMFWLISVFSFLLNLTIFTTFSSFFIFV